MLRWRSLFLNTRNQLVTSRPSTQFFFRFCTARSLLLGVTWEHLECWIPLPSLRVQGKETTTWLGGTQIYATPSYSRNSSRIASSKIPNKISPISAAQGTTMTPSCCKWKIKARCLNGQMSTGLTGHGRVHVSISWGHLHSNAFCKHYVLPIKSDQVNKWTEIQYLVSPRCWEWRYIPTRLGVSIKWFKSSTDVDQSLIVHPPLRRDQPEC